MWSSAMTVLNMRHLFTSSTSIRCSSWLRIFTSNAVLGILCCQAFELHLNALMMLPSGPKLVVVDEALLLMDLAGAPWSSMTGVIPLWIMPANSDAPSPLSRAPLPSLLQRPAQCRS